MRKILILLVFLLSIVSAKAQTEGTYSSDSSVTVSTFNSDYKVLLHSKTTISFSNQSDSVFLLISDKTSSDKILITNLISVDYYPNFVIKTYHALHDSGRPLFVGTRTDYGVLTRLSVGNESRIVVFFVNKKEDRIPNSIVPK